MQTGQKKSPRRVGQRWGSWCLEAEGPDSSPSLKGEKEIQQMHSLSVSFSSLCPGPARNHRDTGVNV